MLASDSPAASSTEAPAASPAPAASAQKETAQIKHELRSRGVSEDAIRKCIERSDLETLLASSKVIWAYIDSYVYGWMDDTRTYTH